MVDSPWNTLYTVQTESSVYGNSYMNQNIDMQ